jgi:FkbM family methyltransferase
MDVYEQNAELRLLSSLVSRVESPTMIDVGAELGAISEHLLAAGVESLHAFDAHPDNAGALSARFGDDPRVTVHQYAVSDGDGSAELHLSVGLDGATLPFGHTLLEREDTDEIAWSGQLAVERRSLSSLVEEGKVPSRVGLVKIDTEGHDLAVVRGMGSLEADVVMVEHWTDLPHGLGLCPWTPEEMIEALASRGFNHYAFLVHREELITVKWDDATVERGAMGNLVFLHDSALERLMPAILECASELAEHAVSVAQGYMLAAEERRALAGDLKQTASERLRLVRELEQTAGDRLALIRRLEQTAQLRLEALETTTEELERRSAELEALKQSRAPA